MNKIKVLAIMISALIIAIITSAFVTPETFTYKPKKFATKTGPFVYKAKKFTDEKEEVSSSFKEFIKKQTKGTESWESFSKYVEPITNYTGMSTLEIAKLINAESRFLINIRNSCGYVGLWQMGDQIQNELPSYWPRDNKGNKLSRSQLSMEQQMHILYGRILQYSESAGKIPTTEFELYLVIHYPAKFEFDNNPNGPSFWKTYSMKHKNKKKRGQYVLKGGKRQRNSLYHNFTKLANIDPKIVYSEEGTTLVYRGHQKANENINKKYGNGDAHTTEDEFISFIDNMYNPFRIILANNE